jgi:glycerol-3-phosphate acyltransferase PlsY
MGLFLTFILLAYLSGSISFAKIIGNYYGVDIQKKGSGNVGFANAVRVLGWKPGSVVLVGDILKGFVPVIIATRYFATWQLAIIALAAIVGHLFPVWLKFRGGKGIATGLGVTLAISPALGLAAIAAYLLGIYYFRKSAPSSVVAAWSLPFCCVFFVPEYISFYVGLAMLATWTHRSNLKQVFNEL